MPDQLRNKGLLAGLRERLHLPGPLYFAQTMFPDPGVSAVLGVCGFDFVMIDVEHGPFTRTSLGACINSLLSTGTPAVVRVSSHSEPEILQALDAGAGGVMLPRVETREQLGAAIRAARFSPEGTRGVSLAVRAAQYGRDTNYIQNANAAVAVIAIIESALGVENIAELVSTPGLDGIIVGSADLTSDLGLGAQYDHEKVQSAIDKVVAHARSAHIKVGARRPKTDEEAAAMLVHCGNDAIVLRTGFETSLQESRVTGLLRK